MSDPLVVVEGLVVRFPLRGARERHATFAAVDGVSLSVGAREIVGIVGESGSGKSTLGRAIAGLQPATAGTVRVMGHDLARLDRGGHRRLTRDVQFVFQDPYASLNPRMSVGAAVERPLLLGGGLSRTARRARVTELLGDVGLPGAVRERYPGELSGGQRQRVAIARALAADPSIIVADEPTASLDVSIQAQILNLLNRLVHERGLTLLLITHDFGAIRAIAQRVVVMHLGEIVEAAGLRELIRQPLHPYTQALLSAVPTTARRPGDRLRLRTGPLSAADPPSGCRLHPRCPVRREDCASVVQALRSGEAGRLVRCAYAPLEDVVGATRNGAGP